MGTVQLGNATYKVSPSSWRSPIAPLEVDRPWHPDDPTWLAKPYRGWDAQGMHIIYIIGSGSKIGGWQLPQSKFYALGVVQKA